MIVGVIDVGTNSVRVLCTDGRTDFERGLVNTRLGEGVDRERKLGAEPMRRTVAAIRDASDRCRRHGAERIRVIATSAVRDASNREDLLEQVRASTGLSPDVLSGEQEARLGFGGATASIDAPPPYLVVDIGGGSTELVRGTRDVEAFVSLDIGSVRLTERHIRSDPPAQDEQSAVRADARAQLDRAVEIVGARAPGTLVGLAGTITTVAALAHGLDRYERARVHHAVVTRSKVEQVREALASIPVAARRELPVMPRGREDVIVAGVLILEQVMDRFGSNSVLVSESDLLDGAAWELLEQR